MFVEIEIQSGSARCFISRVRSDSPPKWLRIVGFVFSVINLEIILVKNGIVCDVWMFYMESGGSRMSATS